MQVGSTLPLCYGKFLIQRGRLRLAMDLPIGLNPICGSNLLCWTPHNSQVVKNASCENMKAWVWLHCHSEGGYSCVVCTPSYVGGEADHSSSCLGWLVLFLLFLVLLVFLFVGLSCVWGTGFPCISLAVFQMLCRSSQPWTQRSICFCLLGARIRGVCPNTQFLLSIFITNPSLYYCVTSFHS